MLIPNPDLGFWNSDAKIHFWANFGRKSQSCLFCLKIRTHGISRILILIPTLVLWISNPKSIFGQIWEEEVKVARFARKLAHTEDLEDVDSYSDITCLNFQPYIHFLGNFELKNSKLFNFNENWHIWYLEDADSCYNISFLNFQIYTHFWVKFGPGSGIACFVWCSCCTSYLEGADYVTGEDEEEGL